MSYVQSANFAAEADIPVIVFESRSSKHL